MEATQIQGALDFSAPFLFAPPPPEPEKKPEVKTARTEPREKTSQPEKKLDESKLKQVPEKMIEKDFATGDWIVWDTIEHQEIFRGTREETLNFNKP